MIERIRAARTPFELVVATTTSPKDDPIRDLCRDVRVACVDGHPVDLLDRHLTAARAFGADAVAKIPSDCPLIDPGVIDRVLAAFLSAPAEYDFVTNLVPPSYPDGNDVEVMPTPVLEAAHAEATQSHEREHTTPFVWQRPERFRIRNVPWETGLDYSRTHRFTIDYPEDHAFVARVYDALWTRERPVFGLEEILSLLEREPSLLALNARWHGVTWQKRQVRELRTAEEVEERP
jgi:spore coat polysaccharide biosynthesis protein SpsF